jgi:hypothetical protein
MLWRHDIITVIQNRTISEKTHQIHEI